MKKRGLVLIILVLLIILSSIAYVEAASMMNPNAASAAKNNSNNNSAKMTSLPNANVANPTGTQTGGDVTMLQVKPKKIIDYFKNDTAIDNALGRIPRAAKRIIYNMKINLNYTEAGETVSLYFIFKKGNLEEKGKGSIEGSNLDVFLTKQDVDDIVKAEDQRKELKNKLESGAVYEAHGLFTKVKISLVKMFL